MYPFSDYELRKIEQLPEEIADLAQKYPIDIVNVAESLEEPPFPENYIPEIIEVYYGDSEVSDILVVQGEIRSFTTRELEENEAVIAVHIDGKWVYIEIEGKELINKLDGIVLPSVIADVPTLAQSIAAKKIPLI